MTDPDADALLRRAAERWLGGDTLAAEIGCREVLALRPGHRDARTLLGAILHDQGRYGEAEPLFLRLTEEEPAQATHWMNLGTIRRSLGRLDESLAAFAMALRVGPLTADLALNLGLLHLDRRDFVSARAILERASRLRPRDAAVRLQLAEACHALLDTDAALTALRGWEDCEGIDVELMARIAQLLVALGAPDLAGPAVERVRAEALSHPRAGLLVVGALLVLGMLLAPPAAGAIVAKRLPGMMLVAAGISVLSAPIGLLLSWHLDLAAGASIVLVAVSSFFLIALLKGQRA